MTVINNGLGMALADGELVMQFVIRRIQAGKLALYFDSVIAADPRPRSLFIWVVGNIKSVSHQNPNDVRDQKTVVKVVPDENLTRQTCI